MTTRMIIVRHGESEWNRIHRYQGQSDAPLSELGEQQAQALALKLKTETIDCIYTSPLQRASRTAEAIHSYHPNATVHHDPALMEIHHGEWQGKYANEVRALFADGLEEWRVHPMRSQMPDGESFSNIYKRSVEFKERVLAEHPDQTVLVSTHDVVIKILVADVLGMAMDNINRIWLTNGSITTIEYNDDMPYLVCLSDASHLGDLAVLYGSQEAL